MSDKFLKSRNLFIPITVGIIFCWFGSLKFFPGMSPAEELVKTTLDHIFFGTIPNNITLLLMGIIECAIGFMLIFYDHLKYTIIASIMHLSCTFIPLLIFPELTMGLTGQYILKNIIIIGALLTIYPFRSKTSALHSYYPETTKEN